MGTVFNSLRGNDLIWNYVASRWLMGEAAPAFDILAWNADGTRLPAAMHSFYLRSCYGQNLLARDELRLAGKRLRLGDITAEVYIVGAAEDHIVPWTSSYATTRLLSSPLRFVLTSSGHLPATSPTSALCCGASSRVTGLGEDGEGLPLTVMITLSAFTRTVFLLSLTR